MTIGSPFAAAVSGPGVAETNAIRLPSGDHVGLVLLPGSGAFVPATSASSLALLPSGLAITRPLFSPTRPRYAIHWPSGDQCGSSDESLSAPKRTLLPSGNVITQTCP